MHSTPAKSVCQSALVVLLGAAPLWLCQCSSLGPSVAVEGELSSPESSLPRYEYPFDEAGRYREDWVSPPSSSKRTANRTRNTTSSVDREPAKPVVSPVSMPAESTPVIVPATQPLIAETALPRIQGRGSHKVGPGDTLWSISRRYGISVADLKALNGFSADTIRSGQIVLIP